ncbi:MAG: hypothetical protein ACO1O1_13240 [Adhaeribacter sp.]
MADSYSRLIRFNEEPLPENFVAIACSIGENNIPSHAAILIRHQKRNYLHHYPGVQPPLVEDDFRMTNPVYLYKMLELFENDEDQIGAVLEYCRFICEKSDITYSLVMDGSKYDHKGDFKGASGLPELGSCVGFCVSTLMSIIQDCDSYFVLNDWPPSTVNGHPYDGFGIRAAKARFPQLDWEKYDLFKRRITPLEYLCSGFIEDYPILKKEIDAISSRVMNQVDALA